MGKIMETLFPIYHTRNRGNNEDVGESPSFCMEELKCTGESLKSRRASGLEGVSNEVIKAVFRYNLCFVLDMFNECLDADSCSTRWM